MQRKSLLVLAAVALVGLLIVVFFQTPDVEDAGVVAAPEVEPVVEVPVETELPAAPAPEETGRTEEPKWAGLDADLERFAAKPEPGSVSVTEDPELWYRFVDAETERPIEGVRLSWESNVHGGAWHEEARQYDVESDEAGLVGLDRSCLPRVLEATAEGYGPIRLRVVDGHRAPSDPAVVRCARGATLVVRFDGEGPVPGSERGVEVVAASDLLVRPEVEEGVRLRPGARFERAAPIGEDGSCVLTDLPSGVPLTLTVPEFFYRHDPPITLDPGEVREVTWRVVGRGSVSGTLVDGRGAAWSGRELVLVRMGRSKRYERVYLPRAPSAYGEVLDVQRTDATGRFRFERLHSGHYYVGPRREAIASEDEDERGSPLFARVELREGELDAEVRLVVHRGLHVAGEVVDPAGQPVPGAFVILGSEFGQMYGRADERGAFRIGPLEPVVHYAVARGAAGLSDSEEISVSPGAPPVRLVLRASGSLSGRVIDSATGEEVAADVGLVTEGAYGVAYAGTQAAVFSFDGLPASTYAVCAKTQDGRLGLRAGLELQAGGSIEDIEVRLAPAARVRVTYAGSLPRVYCEARVADACVASALLEAGETVDLLVPEGLASLRMFQGGEVIATRAIEASRSGPLELTLGLD